MLHPLDGGWQVELAAEHLWDFQRERDAMQCTLTVNGQPRGAEVPDAMPLLWVLRDVSWTKSSTPPMETSANI